LKGPHSSSREENNERMAAVVDSMDRKEAK
jgi:hypothetical protein